MPWMTGQQYLDANPDVKKAGVDPLYHVLTYVLHGRKEPRPLWIDQPEYAPPDWENAAYLYHFPDVAKAGVDPLKHWFENGEREGRKWKPNGWISAIYLKLNPDVAKHSYFGTHPLEHYWRAGMKENRRYLEGSTPDPPGPGPSPGPLPNPPQGLSLIYEDSSDPNEVFSYMEHEGHTYIGKYGLYTGGAKILRDGKVLQQLSKPLSESVFKMQYGLASTENFASMYLLEGDKFAKNYQRPEEESLGLDFERLSNGSYVFLWNHWTGNKSGLARSDNGGKTWYDWKSYNNLILVGLAVDENDQIRLCGRDATGQIVVDVDGRVIFQWPNLKEGYIYWSIISAKGRVNVGTFNSKREDHRFGYIDLIEGTKRTQVYGGCDFPYMHSMAILKGKRYCIATWDWDTEGKNSLLLSSADGVKWSTSCTVPCSSILNIWPINDTWLALCGGIYRKKGVVFAYKP